MVRRRVKVWYRLRRRRLRRFVYHNLLHADDPPHRLALGMAIGIFVAFTPTVGIQMVLAAAISWVMRANKFVSMAVVWLSNPATILPIYWYCYRLGCAVLAQDPIGREWWGALAHPPDGWWSAVVFYWSRFLHIAGPLWLGCVVVGLACAYPVYFIVDRSIRWYRIKRWGSLVRPDGFSAELRVSAGTESSGGGEGFVVKGERSA